MRITTAILITFFLSENMLIANDAGAVIMPASPGFYNGEATFLDLIDFVVARILNQLNIEQTLKKPWGATE